MIIRSSKDNRKAMTGGGYTSMDNRIFEDPALSWQAKGVLAYLLSRPSNWKACLEHLMTVGQNGKSATRSAMRELIEAGYMRKVQVSKPGRGVIFWDHLVFEDKTQSGGVRNNSAVTQEQWDDILEKTKIAAPLGNQE